MGVRWRLQCPRHGDETVIIKSKTRIAKPGWRRHRADKEAGVEFMAVIIVEMQPPGLDADDGMTAMDAAPGPG